MASIRYFTGSALEPVTKGDKKFIVHVCNDIGGWGSGFVVAISNKWKQPEQAYRYWHRENKNANNDKFYKTFHLGMIQPVQVEEDTTVINMIAQRSVVTRGEEKPIRYDALKKCLEKIAIYLFNFRHNEGLQVSVHMPRIGCGLAGGKWEEVEKIIEKTLISKDIPVYVYTLKDDKSWK